MLNLIRSQLYSLRHDRYMYICLAILAAVPVVIIHSLLQTTGGSAMTGSEAFFRSFADFGGMMPAVLSLLLASRISGWDFNDKTINYEVVYGHKRSSIYWTRTLLALGLSAPAALIAALLPMLWFTAWSGWGTMLDGGEVMRRCLLMLPVLMRLVAVFSFLSILLRNSWAALVTGYLLIVGEMMADMLLRERSILLAFSDLQALLYFEDMVIDTTNGAAISYQDTLSQATVTGMLVLSAIVIAAFLIGGRLLFGRRDMQ